MNIQAKSIKQEAAQILRETAPDYRKTVVLHSAVSLGILFLINLISLLLSNAIGDTGGLSDIGLRSILGTTQSTLMTAANILLPFWEAGILYTSIRVAQQKNTQFSMLTRGFRRFGPLLRYMILWMLICIAVAMLCVNTVSILSVFIPISPELEAAISAIDITTITDPFQIYDMIPMELLIQATIPIAVLMFLLCFGAMLYLSYRFYLSQYLLLDETPVRARAALALSGHLTKGHKKSLLMLDLSFWWYYVLQCFIVALAYAPEILSVMGIEVPMSAGMASVLFYGLYCIVSLILTWFAGAYVHTARACAYDHLRKVPENV